MFKLSSSANCEEDIDRFVYEADSLADLQSQSPDPNTVANVYTYYISQVIYNDVEMIPNTSETHANNVSTDPSDVSALPDVSSLYIYGGIDLQDSNVVAYIAGYLIKKTLKNLNVTAVLICKWRIEMYYNGTINVDVNFDVNIIYLITVKKNDCVAK